MAFLNMCELLPHKKPYHKTLNLYKHMYRFFNVSITDLLSFVSYMHSHFGFSLAFSKNLSFLCIHLQPLLDNADVYTYMYLFFDPLKLTQL